MDEPTGAPTRTRVDLSIIANTFGSCGEELNPTVSQEAKGRRPLNNLAKSCFSLLPFLLIPVFLAVDE